MKLDSRGKAIRIRLKVGGEEHSTLESLKEHFDIAEIYILWQNGSLSRWLKQIGANDVEKKLAAIELSNHQFFTVNNAKRLLACFGIQNLDSFYKAKLKKYEQEGNNNKIIETLQLLAQDGNSDAAFKLSECYLTGKYGCAPSEEKYFNYSLMAAKGGHAQAQNNVAQCYFNGKGVAKSLTNAISWFHQAYKRNHADAAYFLGNLFFKSGEDEDGSESDYVKALTYYQLAAESNIEDSDIKVAYCLHKLGRDEEAATCYNQSIQRKGLNGFDSYFLYDYAMLLEEKSPQDKAIDECLRKAAKKNYPPAQAELGYLYIHGEHGIEKNPNEGIYWIRMAAEANDMDGQAYLGFCYDMGYGVKKNSHTAKIWYSKAALQGNLFSIKILIDKYPDYTTTLIKQNEELRTIFNQAADNGEKEVRGFILRALIPGNRIYI